MSNTIHNMETTTNNQNHHGGDADTITAVVTATATATATTARDMDDLEGTLLPVATHVIPVTEIFDYDTAIAKEEQQEQEIEGIAIPDNANQLNYAGVSDDSKTTVGKAEITGKIRSEEELEYIRKANRKVYPRNYHEENTYKSANELAKQRDREGLQVKNDRIRTDFTDAKLPPTLKTKSEEEEGQQNKQPTNTGGGYQVKDYDCGNYDTTSYDVKEYKSVYD